MTKPANAVRKVGGMIGLAMAVRIISQGLGLLLVLVAGRLLSIEEFGLFALSMIALNLSTATLYSGVYDFVLKEPDFHAHRSTAFTMHMAICLFFSGLILVLAAITHFAFGATELALYIASTAAIPILLMLACWHEAVLLRKGDVTGYYWIMLACEVLGFAAAVSLLFAGFGVWALILGRYVGSLGMAVLLSIVGVSLPALGWAAQQVKEISRYSAGLYSSAMMTFFSSYSADILIGGVLNARSVGLFRMGSRMATAAYDVGSQATRIVAWQALGRSAREGGLQDGMWVKIYALFVLFVMIALGSVFILAKPLTLLVLGERWLEMIPILRIICVLYMIRAIDLISMVQLSAAGDTGFVFKAKCLQLIILLVSIFATVRFGSVAVAFGLYPSAVVLFCVYVRRLIATTGVTLGSFVREMIPVGICAGATLLAVFFACGALASQMLFLQLIGPIAFGGSVMILLMFFPLRTWVVETSQAVSVAILPRAE